MIQNLWMIVPGWSKKSPDNVSSVLSDWATNLLRSLGLFGEIQSCLDQFSDIQDPKNLIRLANNQKGGRFQQNARQGMFGLPGWQHCCWIQ